MLYILLIFVLLITQNVNAIFGQLGACITTPDKIKEFNGPTKSVDVYIDSISFKKPQKMTDEILIAKDINFDEINVNYIAAVELLFEANCKTNCSDILEIREPWKCNNHIFDLSVYGYYYKRNIYNNVRIAAQNDINFDSSQILFTFSPGDRFLTFRNPFDPEFENGYLKLGRKMQSPYSIGQIMMRLAFIDKKNTALNGNSTHYFTKPVILRFYTLVPEENSCLSQTGMVTITNYDPKVEPQRNIKSRIYDQMEDVLVDSKTIKNLIKSNQAERMKIMGLSVHGHNWLTSYSVEFLYKDQVIYTINSGIINSWEYPTTLSLSNPMYLTEHTSIHYVCTYDNTKYPFIDVPKSLIKNSKILIGPKPSHAPCILRFQLSSTKCSAQTIYNNNRELIHNYCGSHVLHEEKCNKS